MEESDIVVIGGGSAGYVAAIRGAQLGAKVTLIERDNKLGGTCLNRGCIPTKVLLEAAHLLSSLKKAPRIGITVDNVHLHLPTLMKHKQEVVDRLCRGVEYLIKNYKITFIQEMASIVAPGIVQIKGNGQVSGKAIIIATGAKPLAPRVDGIQSQGVWNSDEALEAEVVPQSVLILGGGVIGLEFADFWHSLGSKITIVEKEPHILPREDDELAKMMEEIMHGKGMDIITGATVTEISGGNGDKRVTVEKDGKTWEIDVEIVLNAVGRAPNINDIGLEKLGLDLSKGRIIVNEVMETAIDSIYAAGDVIGEPMLAHAAMKEGIVAAEAALGMEPKAIDYRIIPTCAYTSPELAGVGLTEEAARKESDILVGRFPLSASGRALTLGATGGLVKVIADSEHGQILGVRILAPNASEMIAEAVQLMCVDATIDDLAQTVHAHPTLSEALMEAALDARKQAIHILSRK